MDLDRPRQTRDLVAAADLHRQLALERERIANHLGYLGYLGNDGGLAFGLAQFLRLKEDVLRLNAELFGHRYMMDYVIPGGVERNVGRHGCDELAEQSERLALASTEGKIQLALRNPLDQGAPQTPGVKPAILMGMVKAPATASTRSASSSNDQSGGCRAT